MWGIDRETKSREAVMMSVFAGVIRVSCDVCVAVVNQVNCISRIECSWCWCCEERKLREILEDKGKYGLIDEPVAWVIGWNWHLSWICLGWVVAARFQSMEFGDEWTEAKMGLTSIEAATWSSYISVLIFTSAIMNMKVWCLLSEIEESIGLAKLGPDVGWMSCIWGCLYEPNWA